MLVKGLDFALLEQTRARVAEETAATEDVSLEQAFLESSTQPKKRTKEEILRELKSKRGAGAGAGSASTAPTEADKALEEAKKAGKFKPIGFKPIGGGAEKGAEGKVKRKKKVKPGELEENGERKKKRKVAAEATSSSTTARDTSAPVQRGQSSEPSAADTGAVTPVAGPSSTSKPPGPEAAPMDEDFDIFAGAGEYTGVDLGDDDDGSDDDESKPRPPEDEDGELRDSSAPRPGKWLATSDDEREATPPPATNTRDSESATRSVSPQRQLARAHHGSPSPEEDGEMEEERPLRLQPLASSALPSIKDLIAMSEEAEKAEKRKARKEKKKAGGGGGGGGGSSEKDTKAKVERDYQR